MTLRFDWMPDIPALLAAGDDPQRYTLALLGQLRRLTEWIAGSTAAWTEEEAGHIGWIAMELVSNAIASAPGSALGTASGLPRGELLDVLGTSAIWPGPESLWRPGGSARTRAVFENALGMNPAEWLRLPPAERFGALGIDPAAGWVLLSCLLDPETGAIDLRVTSKAPPLRGDLEEITGRLSDPEAARVRIAAARKPFRDDDGMYHMPSFTGGGGMGLIECVRASAGLGLALDLAGAGEESEGVTLRLHGRD